MELQITLFDVVELLLLHKEMKTFPVKLSGPERQSKSAQDIPDIREYIHSNTSEVQLCLKMLGSCVLLTSSPGVNASAEKESLSCTRHAVGYNLALLAVNISLVASVPNSKSKPHTASRWNTSEAWGE